MNSYECVFARTVVLVGLGLAATLGSASAQMKVGVTVSATGPASILGGPQMSTIPILPKEISGVKVEYVALDDATSPTQAALNAQKLVTQELVDLLLGTSTAAGTLPLIDIAAGSKTPLIVTTAGDTLVAPLDDKKRWAYKIVPNEDLVLRALAQYLAKQGSKTIGFIGFSDAYGQTALNAAKTEFAAVGINIIATEFYARTDTSVTGQALKLISSNPDAVFVGASGAPAVLPASELRARGYSKPIYQTHGVASPAFIQAGGKIVEGTIFAGEPFIIANDLPNDNPIKKISFDYIARMREVGKPATIFGAHLVDAMTLASAAVPDALKKGKPGTEEFRIALRDSLENIKRLPLNNGILSTSAVDHCGYGLEAVFLIKIENGEFRMMK